MLAYLVPHPGNKNCNQNNKINVIFFALENLTVALQQINSSYMLISDAIAEIEQVRLFSSSF